jgi:hypothetical protein
MLAFPTGSKESRVNSRHIPLSVISALFVLCSTLSFGAELNYNTGAMSLSIPLMQVSGNSLSYSVNLRYTSNVARGHLNAESESYINPERAGWAGLGFDVDVPYIERTIVGGPDNAGGHTRVYQTGRYYGLGGAVDSIKNALQRNDGKLFFGRHDHISATPRLSRDTAQHGQWSR